MTSHPTDDGFHEIQLNGKQLVFLFMAATVVSVVIFLCGVLVGRGVRTERGSTLAEVPTADQVAPTVGLGAPEVAAIRSAVPPPAIDDHPSVVERLEKRDPGLDELKVPAAKAASDPVPAAPRPAPLAVSSPPPAAKAVPPAPKPATQASASAAPTSRPSAPAAGGAKSGYIVQLVATNSRSEADALAKRLNAKGYEAYVQAPADNAPVIFRVRVGNYATRSEAENAAAKLEKEGKFKPWVAAR